MKNADQSAFPFVYQTSDGSQETHTQCLTKREYFAVKAMQGFISKDSWDKQIIEEAVGDNSSRSRIAKASIILADELLRQLETKGQ